VHPVGSECVPWISIQGDIICLGALLGALLVLDEPRPWRILAGTALFALAAGSKESGVVLPVLLLIRAMWLPRTEGSNRRWASALIVLLVAAVAYTVVRQHMVIDVAGQAAAHRPWYGESWFATVGAFFGAVVYYAGTILLPVELTLRWMPRSPPVGWLQIAALVVGVLLVLGTVASGLLLRRRRPVLATGLLLALVTLGPASSLIVPLPTVSEVRYLYPVLAFLALAVAPAVDRIPVRVTLVPVILLAALTVRRAEDWHSDMALWKAAVERPRRTPEALRNLSVEYYLRALDRDRVEHAAERLADFQEANGLLLRYVTERLEHVHLMADAEKQDLANTLTAIAIGLLELRVPGDALPSLAAALDVAGPTPERLRILADVLDALGRHANASAARRDAADLERWMR
jgi:hypothetical protein